MCGRTWLRAALCLALTGNPLSAQPEPPYALEGTVRDATGGVIVGARVTLSSADAPDRTTQTNAAGQFRFAALRGDRYAVTVAADGFAEVRHPVGVGDRPVATVEVVLQVLVTEHIEVATPVGGAGTAGLTATTLSGAALEALPDDPGALLMRLRELAGATDASAPVTVMVDGFHQSIRLPPKQAIQAIRISSNWFAPEFAEPGQARVDIITKPGGSAVHGEAKLTFNDESMNARNPLAAKRPSGQMRDMSGYVSGPIVPGRWSFTVYGGHWLQRHTRVINATIVDPATLQPVPYVDDITAPARVGSIWAGTTYQVAPAHTLAVSFSRTTEDADRLGLETGLDLPERAYRRDGADDALRVTLTSVAGRRAFNEFRAQLNPRRSVAQAHSAAPAVTVFDAFNGGGNQEALMTTTRHVGLDVAESFTWAAPRHTIKAGIDARATWQRYADRTYFGGAFVFGGDFERDRDGTPLVDASGGRVAIAPLENFRRTLAGLPGYGPSQFWIARGDPDVRFADRWIGGFVQDDWTVSPRLALSYGLRSEWQTAAARPGLGTRAGMAVALDGARRHVVRAGAGVFFQRIEPELTLDVRRLDGRHQEQVLVEHPAFFPGVPAELGDAAALLPMIRRADPRLRAPQFLITAVSYERQLATASFLTVKYGFQRGSGLLRTRNVNAPDAAGRRDDPDFGPVLQYEATGRLRRHQVTAGWRWNPGARAALFANYGFLHGRSDTDGRMTIPADSGRLDEEYGPVAGDRPHQATVGATLTVPGGLVISPYLTAASGRAFNITTGFDNNGDGVFTDRPVRVAPVIPGAIETPYGWFLVDGTPAGAVVPRNSGREPAAVRADLRLTRTFRAYAAGTLMVAANVENLLNRATFEGINGVATSASFGRPNRAVTPRRITVSASVGF